MRISIILLLLLVAGFARAQKLDLNTNGMSDVWEWTYGAGGLGANVDTDGDGVPNKLEAIAGTDPFDSNSVPRIPMMSYTTSNFSVTMPAALGKLYQLESSPPPTNGSNMSWTFENGAVARGGAYITLTAPTAGSTRYFRVMVADVDTDGDGLSDWEEYKLGLDPFKSASSGQLDGNGQPVGDYAHAAAKILYQNIVSITATDPSATQPDSNSPASAGIFTISRSGFPLDSIAVNVTTVGSGPGYAQGGVDYTNLPTLVNLPAGVSSQSVFVSPMANPSLAAPALVTLRLLPGPKYTLGNPTNASVVINPVPSATGTGLTGNYYNGSSATYTNSTNFYPSNLFLTRVDSNVDFNYGTNTSPNLSNGNYTVRWTGQVQPQYTETYFFETTMDDGVKLWVNDQLIIDRWGSGGTGTGSINLHADVRYNIRIDYRNTGGSAQAHLKWYSASQARVPVPQNRLYPATNAPTSVTSSLTAVAFLNQPFSFTVTGANTTIGYTATGLPPGLGFNTTNGSISGTPTLAGSFQITLTATNSNSLAASALDLQVIDTGSSVTREVWTGVGGTNVSDIPLNTPANSTNILGTLEGITNYGDNYGERIRGYFTAPVSGNYFFWLAANDNAELWISNDNEPVNKVKRATASGTAPRQWNLQPGQRSKWLALVAGERYYVEILHKAGVGTNDNWAVAWMQDPVGTNSVPGTNAIVPGYLISKYFAPPPIYVPGTLYFASMLAQNGVNSTGSGEATLRVNADGTQAILKYNYTGLTGPITSEHIHSDAYLNYPSTILFDIDTAIKQPDGSLVWDIVPVGSITNTATIAELIREGRTYINLHTALYPGGEINGHFSPVDGSQTFTPPPQPPVLSDDSANTNAAVRFLNQASFGVTSSDISALQTVGYSGWLDYQMALPATHHLPEVLNNPSADPSSPYSASQTFNTWWKQSVTAPDQLRQRVAFALSEIMVVSQQGVLSENPRALSSYYDTLLDYSFGNYRELLEAVTLHPAMGLYLDMRGNQKGSITAGTHPNENYAREIMQLFSVGLNRMWPDGTLVLDSTDNLVPTYDQNVIMGFAADFTGWNYYQPLQTNGHLPANSPQFVNYTNAMVLVPSQHDLGTKRLLDNVVLRAAQGLELNTGTTNFDNYCLQDLEQALDSIFYNENVGPYICRQLIQRLVTSHPSRDYIYRVVQKFNDNGSGVRGDLSAVVRAILLDYEARSTPASLAPTFGKQREPLLRVTATARAFPPPTSTSGTYTQGANGTITVTTSSPHLLATSMTVPLIFTEATTNVPPASQAYSITVTGANTFTINAPGINTATYLQSSNVITVTNNGHGLLAGYEIYLLFTSGGASNGIYTVATVPNGNVFTVTASEITNRNGNALFPKITGGGYTYIDTNVTLTTPIPHGLNVGDRAYITFSYTIPTNGEYGVSNVANITNFSIVAATSNNTTLNGDVIFPLVPPPVNRNGTVNVQFNTWAMGVTDPSGGSGNSPSLMQTPLNSPTVFNFFYPDFKFPGTLASAGLTTPEFQLTSDTTVALQMNFMEGGILITNNNVNGISSFAGGNGSIVLNLSPWMTTNYTANANLPVLVDSLSTLLTAGQMSAAAKSNILAYVSNTNNFPYTTNAPTSTQMAGRVRAVVHLITASPDFSIQK